MNPLMKDPAAGVPAQLLPHLHLVSKYRYPVTSNPAVDTIVGYLLEASKIVRDLQPMQWQFVDTPPDGTLILEWQPLEYLGTSYASDGFIWADVEHVFKSEVRGYTLEMFLQRAGYRAAGEAMATHSRRRYRLLPSNPAHGLTNPDPSLWLTHYSKASARDHVPAANIPIMPHTHALIQQRRLIQSQGQLPRKEFMLHDRSNWPVIHLPPGVARPSVQGQIPAGPGHRRGTSIAQEATVEDEEDVSRGDLLDFMTPREISRVRYEQHHDWMEEMIESPYPTLSIVPTDLGLGRKGQLEDLTKNFFDAPVAAGEDSSDGPPPRVGKLALDEADDFLKRASDKLVVMQAELVEMRKKHAKRMEKLRRSSILTTAEKKLRTAAHVPEGQGTAEGSTTGDMTASSRDAVDEIMGSVESDVGQKLAKTTTVTLIFKGGLEERKKTASAPVTLPEPNASQPRQAANVSTMTITSTQQAQQQPQMQPLTTNVQDRKPAQHEVAATLGTSEPTETQPASGPTAISSAQPRVEPAADEKIEPEPTAIATAVASEVPQLDDIEQDIDMDGMNEQAEVADQGGDEWVMIGEDGAQDSLDDLGLPDDNEEPQPQAAATASGEEVGAPAANAQQQPQAQGEQAGQLHTPDFDLGGDFDNVEVDTAGDALASLGNSYGDDEDLNLDNMEGSAFGDAFHPEDEEIS